MTRSDIGPFGIVPRWLMRMEKIKGGDVYMYAILADHADRSDGTSYYSHKKMAKEMGSSVSAVKRHLGNLEKHGAISIKKRKTSIGGRTSNEYTVHQVPPKKARTPQSENGLTPYHGRPGIEQEPLNETLRGEEENAPSARNLNSSGEKVEKWISYLTQLDSRRGEGILSYVDNVDAYVESCAQGRSYPPEDIDITLLQDVALAVKNGMGLKTVRLPLKGDMQYTAEWFGRLQADKGADFLPWLEWASAQVVRKGSLAKAKLLLNALTQSGTLRSFSEWEAERVNVVV